MFIKRLLFIGIIALLLTSCTMTETSKSGSKKAGKKISEEEATALFDEFQEKAPSKVGPYRFSVVEQYYLKRAEETLTFSNYRFTELVSKNYYDGATMAITTKMSYGDNSFSLPSGWERALQAKSKNSVKNY